MNRVLVYLVRFAVIVLGFAVAALSASAFLHLLVAGAAGLPPQDLSAVFAGPAIISVPFVALFGAYFAFVPSIFAILAAEVLSLRGWLYHALAGGVVGLVAAGAVLWPQATVPGDAMADAGLLGAIVGAGMVGGSAYWLVAGRLAGRWRDGLTSQPTP